MSIIHVSLQMGLRSDQYFTLKLAFSRGLYETGVALQDDLGNPLE